jgi:hypothetical protein
MKKYIHVDTTSEANIVEYINEGRMKDRGYTAFCFVVGMLYWLARVEKLERRTHRLEQACRDGNVYSEKEARDTFKDLNKTLDDILAKLPKKGQKTEEPDKDDESFLE